MSNLFLIHYFGSKILIATVVGMIIGLEREFKNKSAGLKTMTLVSVGCSLFGSAALLFFPQSEAARLISQMISGIGFIGAGVIFKGDDKVKGLTTACFIWVLCSISLLIIFSHYLLAILISLGCVIFSISISYIEKIFIHASNK